MDSEQREQFRVYVAGRSAALLRTAYVLTGNRPDAEDLLQTALAGTLLAWGRIRGLGIAVGTVKSTVSRALVRLRQDAGLRDDPRADLPPFPIAGAKSDSPR